MTFRPAGPDDAQVLGDLERDANLASLGHVFAPSEHPFPEGAVVARWRAVLAEPGVSVEVVDGVDDSAGLRCYVAHDATTLRHLAVHPDAWGEGLARRAVERAVASIRAAGGRPRLWCLVENHRAQGLYAHLGWVASGVERRAEWPPHPAEVELVLGPAPDAAVADSPA